MKIKTEQKYFSRGAANFLLKGLLMAYLFFLCALYVYAQGNCGVIINKLTSYQECSITGSNNIIASKNDVSVSLSGIVVPPCTYLWSNGVTTPSQTGLAQGCYTLTLTDAANCTATDTVCMPIFTGISITVTTTDATCNTCYDGYAIAAGNGGKGKYYYNWSNGVSTYGSIPGDSSGPIGPGTYTVCVNDSVSCVCATVIIKSAVGIAEQNSPQIKIYPNPANQNISIEFLEVKMKTEDWQITNILGEIVLNGKFEYGSTGTSRINISALPPGSYLLKINTSDKVLTKLIQKSD